MNIPGTGYFIWVQYSSSVIVSHRQSIKAAKPSVPGIKAHKECDLFHTALYHPKSIIQGHFYNATLLLQYPSLETSTTDCSHTYWSWVVLYVRCTSTRFRCTARDGNVGCSVDSWCSSRNPHFVYIWKGKRAATTTVYTTTAGGLCKQQGGTLLLLLPASLLCVDDLTTYGSAYVQNKTDHSEGCRTYKLPIVLHGHAVRVRRAARFLLSLNSRQEHNGHQAGRQNGEPHRRCFPFTSDSYRSLLLRD